MNLTSAPGSRRRLWLVAAPAVMLLLLIGPASAASTARVTQPARATAEDKNPERLYSTPSVAVDPKNHLNVVTSFMDARTRLCGIRVSRDGGTTWSNPNAKASPDAYPFCMDEQFDTMSNPVAFGRDGTLYQAFDGWATSDGGWAKGNVSVFLARSKDLGQTWQTTTVRDARGKVGVAGEGNGPMTSLAIDSHSGSADIVYVGFNTDYPGHRVDQINRLPYQPRMAVSTDGGNSFSEPINFAERAFTQASLRAEALAGIKPGSGPSTPPPAGSKAATPDQVGNFGGWGLATAIDAKGTVYAEWTSTTSNISSPPAAHYLSRSTDHGKTWTHTRITPLSYDIYQFVAGGLAWTPDGGSDGTLHAVYDFNPRTKVASYGEVFYVQSRDAGKTWSNPRSISGGGENSAQLLGQFYGNLSVAPNGRLDAVWWDSRNDPGIQGYDVYYSSSSDNGASWSQGTRVTAQTISRKFGIWGQGYDMTSPPAIASTNDYAMMAWDDTSLTDPALADNANLGGGLQDVVTAAVQYHPVAAGGSNNNGLRVALAVIAGVQAAGIILIFAAFVGRAPRRARESTVAVT
ncbi:MAG: glycoside hydrolase [Actinomycetota bacterium]|nr:glycoside hydrolase [Actinomycetota bacterium]